MITPFAAMFKIFVYYSVLMLKITVLMAHKRFEANTRIMKGKGAERGMFPYLASLWLFDDHACGAAIIGELWVLTAAHCVHYRETGAVIEDDILSVSVGNDSYKSGQVHKIERKIVHEGFDFADQVNDIALLKVMIPFKFSATVQPIMLNPYPIDDYLKPVESVVAGWGLTEVTYHAFVMAPTEKLRYAHVNTIPLPYCRVVFVMAHDPFIPGETNICVFTMVGRGTCAGDSGGPLVANNQLIAILSIGGTCDNTTPEIYTRISSYYTWIKKALGETTNLCDKPQVFGLNINLK